MTALNLSRFGTLIAFLLLCIGFSIAAPQAFATQANVYNLIQQMATLAIVATAATLVMTIGEFDLSVGFSASLAAVICFALFGQGYDVWLAVPAALLAGLAAGVANGVLVARFGIPSFVATLALGTILSGLAFGASGGASMFKSVPDGFKSLARGDVFGVPVLALWIAAVLGVASFVLTQTEFGRRLRAIGGNAQAARLAGLPVMRDVIVTFAVAGGLSALAGLLLASRLGSVQHTMGEPLLLPAYAAVFIGTTASPTGTPSVAGTLLGVAITGVLANGMTILGVDPFIQKILTGVIIIVAVLLRRMGRTAQ
ncbi:dolichyl-phosphate beta-glucosyltransferase [Youhaiella tibetensis]|uniref:ABC transporter permease n=1 Tax=Paradevosia tibetensis TaxID=1447062 RepID=A0A5B9DKB7_9HYPH|nr:ABC transporter permease [Youhaiella tibetensis]AKR54560.1 Ribose ABC transport system, permease protein RbsC [Devosia sp. H5989]QEE19680.1 ABC transporter permease [Youhaiella tibetensis]GGF30941.1 dolichyl-phosphate beta-glucosyltransferase [Youhaiella tibetensis]